jgi:hypothetical protein
MSSSGCGLVKNKPAFSRDFLTPEKEGTPQPNHADKTDQDRARALFFDLDKARITGLGNKTPGIAAERLQDTGDFGGGHARWPSGRGPPTTSSARLSGTTHG